MKKLLVLYFILVCFILNGCESTKRADTSEVIQLYNANKKSNVVSYDYKNWSEYIKTEYGINIDVNELQLNDNISDTINILSKYRDGGIIKLPIDLFYQLESYEFDLIRPLNSIIEEFNDTATVPSGLLTYGRSLSDQDIWCLPAEYSPRIYVRAYNHALIDEAMIHIPQNPDELFEALISIMSIFPDKELIEVPAHIEPDFLNPFSDIFSFNGINNLNTIQFDRDKESYQNINNAKGLQDTLEYISNISRLNIYKLNTQPNTIMTFNNNEFTKLVDINSIHNEGYIYSDKAYCFISRNEVNNVFIVTGKDRGSKSDFRSFIELFFNDTETYTVGRFGIPNQLYKNIDGKLTFKEKTTLNDTILPNITIFGNYDISRLNNSVNLGSVLYNDYYNYATDYIRPYWFIPVLTHNVYSNFHDYKRDQRLFCDVFINLLLQNVSAVDILNEYGKLCKIYELDKKISEANLHLASRYKND